MAVEISKFDIHPSVLGTLCYIIRGMKTTFTGPAEQDPSRVTEEISCFVYWAIVI